MEIHKKLHTLGGANDQAPTAGKLGSDITASTRESIREVADSKRVERRDRIELSGTARTLKGQGTLESDDRAQRVETLKTAYESGSLNSPELVERAARGLMRGN